MVSEFRRKKYMHVFYVFFDTDRSGSIDRNDFSLATQKFAKKRGYTAGESTYELLKQMLTAVWDGLIKAADSDGDGVVNVEEWVRIWDEYAKNPAGGQEWQKLYAKCLFQVADAGNDGSVDAEEFGTVCESFGLDKNESVDVFNKMAGNKTSIDWEEYQKLFNEYFTTEDPNAPGNYIFGKPKAK